MTDCLERECSETLTGLHEWKLPKAEDKPQQDIFGNYIEYPICIFCGLIDNREEDDTSL